MIIDVRSRRVRASLERVITAALSAADPARAIRRVIRVDRRALIVAGRRYPLRRVARVMVVGAGKASGRMAAALERVIARWLPTGLVAVKYGHDAPTRMIPITEAGHPIPDAAGQRAAAEVLRRVAVLRSEDLLIVLLSGGASALWPAPAAGISLQDKQQTTDLLLRCGATIHEMNAVRKHLSAIKGGRLAVATKARVLSLILSDVLGDDLGTIGSGPTAPDPTTYRDARAILTRYRIWKRIPARVRTLVMDGCRGRRPESPKPGAAVFRRVQHLILGNAALAREAAAAAARRSGRRTFVLLRPLTGETREAARLFVATVRAIRSQFPRIPICVIGAGETTVTVRGRGVGGRAQEFALAAAMELDGLADVHIAAVGTDGTDGPTDAAGAVVDGETVRRAARRRISARHALARHDSHTFFRRVGGLITTGPTGTNVNDLYLAILN